MLIVVLFRCGIFNIVKPISPMKNVLVADLRHLKML